jgi:hypothetical protein
MSEKPPKNDENKFTDQDLKDIFGVKNKSDEEIAEEIESSRNQEAELMMDEKAKGLTKKREAELMLNELGGIINNLHTDTPKPAKSNEEIAEDFLTEEQIESSKNRAAEIMMTEDQKELSRKRESGEKPNPTLQELADRVELALKTLTEEEKDSIMTDVLFGLLMKVKNNKEAASKSVTNNALNLFEGDIKDIEEQAEKIKKKKEIDAKYEAEINKVISKDQKEDSESREWDEKANAIMSFEQKEASRKNEGDFILNTLPKELPPLPINVEIKSHKEYSKKIDATSIGNINHEKKLPELSESEKIEVEKKENLLKQLKDKFIRVSPALQEIIRNSSTKIESPDPDAKFIRMKLSDLGLKSFPNKKITLADIYKKIEKYENRTPEEKYGLEPISSNIVFEACLNIEKPKFGKVYFLGTNTIKDNKGDQKIISLKNNFNKATATDTDMDLADIQDSRNDPEVFEDDDSFIFKKKKIVFKKK